MQQYLIDSILRGYDLPKLYFSKPGEKASSGMTFDVVDGQQRLTAIFAFMSDEVELGDTSGTDKIDGHDVSGLKWSDLPDEFRIRVMSFSLSVGIIEDASKDEIRDIFLRLQEGKTLNPPEKRNAIECKLRDDVVTLAKHKFFEKKVSSKDSRFSHCDWIAHAACLVANNGPADLSAASLKKLYIKSKSGLLNDGAVEAGVRGTLNTLAKIFSDDEVPELNVKWGFVDLFYLVWQLKNQYVVDGAALKALEEFYKVFELERRKIKGDPEALLLPSYTGEIDGRQMFDYREKFVREGMKSESIAVRARVYLRSFIARYPQLQLKDPKRAFSFDERLIVWRLGGEACSECQKKISLKEAEADHIFAHSKGGKTNFQNAQCLCVDCNRSKGSK